MRTEHEHEDLTIAGIFFSSEGGTFILNYFNTLSASMAGDQKCDLTLNRPALYQLS